MQVRLDNKVNYKDMVDLLSDNEKASKIYIDICNKNHEIDELVEVLNSILNTSSDEELEYLIRTQLTCIK